MTEEGSHHSWETVEEKEVKTKHKVHPSKPCLTIRHHLLVSTSSEKHHEGVSPPIISHQ